MTPWFRFTGRVDGHFRCSDPSRLKALWQELHGKEVEVAVRIARKKRTLDQNALIHVLAEQVSLESGYTLLEVKRRATLEALGVEEAIDNYTLFGRDFIEVRGTSTLNTRECSLVVDVLIKQAEFLGIVPRNAEHVEVM